MQEGDADVDPDGDMTDLDADPDVDVDPDADDRSEQTVSIDQTDEDDNPSYRNVRPARCVCLLAFRLMLSLHATCAAAVGFRHGQKQTQKVWQTQRRALLTGLTCRLQMQLFAAPITLSMPSSSGMPAPAVIRPWHAMQPALYPAWSSGACQLQHRDALTGLG